MSRTGHVLYMETQNRTELLSARCSCGLRYRNPRTIAEAREAQSAHLDALAADSAMAEDRISNTRRMS